MAKRVERRDIKLTYRDPTRQRILAEESAPTGSRRPVGTHGHHSSGSDEKPVEEKASRPRMILQRESPERYPMTSGVAPVRLVPKPEPNVGLLPTALKPVVAVATVPVVKEYKLKV